MWQAHSCRAVERRSDLQLPGFELIHWVVRREPDDAVAVVVAVVVGTVDT